MEKITFLCLSQFINNFNDKEADKLLMNIHKLSEWFPKSVGVLGTLESFDEVQKELLNLAQFIAQGKVTTNRLCSNLLNSLKKMQLELIGKLKIVVFVTDKVKLKFNENVEVIIIKNEDECIDFAYSLQNELKYLVYMKNEKVNNELKNAVDILLNFEDLIEGANTCYPIDSFTYDRLFLTAKFNKIKHDQSKILITGYYQATVDLFEDKMPYSLANVAINNQDLYYTLLSVKKAIGLSNSLDTILIFLPYYFFFTNITLNLSEDKLMFLSKVNYPIYNVLHGYRGKLYSLYIKSEILPIYESIINLEDVRDIYYDAIMKDLENMTYYNSINKKDITYNFLEKSDEQNYIKSQIITEKHNAFFDLDEGTKNRNLLSKFLDNMEELNKKVILIVPPVTKFYRKGISNQLKGVCTKMVKDVVDSHTCCTFIDLFRSDKFNDEDFCDYEYLNVNGTIKLSKLICDYVK